MVGNARTGESHSDWRPSEASGVHHGGKPQMKAYGALGVEMAIDFAIMYFVMYTMIATIDHLYLNLNSVYMTLMMVAPMTVIMLISMRSMFPSRRLNWMVAATAVLVFVASFAAMRTQAAIGDRE